MIVSLCFIFFVLFKYFLRCRSKNSSSDISSIQIDYRTRNSSNDEHEENPSSSPNEYFLFDESFSSPQVVKFDLFTSFSFPHRHRFVCFLHLEFSRFNIKFDISFSSESIQIESTFNCCLIDRPSFLFSFSKKNICLKNTKKKQIEEKKNENLRLEYF